MAKNSKEGILSVRDMTGGMSSDEYVGGSFLLSNKIDIFSSSQSYRLSKGITIEPINNRSGGYITQAIYVPYISTDPLLLSQDGYVESADSWNDGSTGTVAPTSSGFGALYRKQGALLIGEKTRSSSASDIFVIGSKLDRLKISNTMEEAGIMDTVTNLTNPGITSDTGWTVGTGWTTGATGAVHTAGNTADLTQAISPSGVGYYRLVVRTSNHTAGTVTVKRRGSSLGSIQAETSGRLRTFVFATGGGTSGELTFTPSSSFDGTIRYADLREYNSNLIVDEVTLSASSPTCHIQDGGFLYVGTGNYVDIIDTTSSTWVLDDTLEFPVDHIIVGITKIGNTFNIYCRDGQNGWKYFWNGVDDFPSEKVFRKGMQPYSVENDGNIDYVSAFDSLRTHLLKSSGWDKQIMYSSSMDYISGVSYPQGKNIEVNHRLYMESTGHGLATGGGFLAIQGLDDIMVYGSATNGVRKGLTKYYRTGDQARFVDYCKGRFYTNYSDPTFVDTNNYLASWNMLSGLSRTYTDSGYIIYNPIFWDKESTTKELLRAKVGCLLQQDDQKINLYVSINDNHYATFYVSGVTTAPLPGDTYTVSGLGTYTVVTTDITGGAGTISCTRDRSGNFVNFYGVSGFTLTRTSGVGDSSISASDADTFIKIKSIAGNDWDMKGEIIFTPDKSTVKLPNWNKIQFKVELVRGASVSHSPEVYNLEVLARPVLNDGI